MLNNSNLRLKRTWRRFVWRKVYSVGGGNEVRFSNDAEWPSSSLRRPIAPVVLWEWPTENNPSPRGLRTQNEEEDRKSVPSRRQELKITTTATAPHGFANPAVCTREMSVSWWCTVWARGRQKSRRQRKFLKGLIVCFGIFGFFKILQTKKLRWGQNKSNTSTHKSQQDASTNKLTHKLSVHVSKGSYVTANQIS